MDFYGKKYKTPKDGHMDACIPFLIVLRKVRDHVNKSNDEYSIFSQTVFFVIFFNK